MVLRRFVAAALVWISLLQTSVLVLTAQSKGSSPDSFVSLIGPSLSELIVDVPTEVQATRDGLVITEQAGWVRTKRTFRNFKLRFEAQIDTPSTRALLTVRGLPPLHAAPWTGYAFPVAGVQRPDAGPADSPLVWLSANPAGLAAALGSAQQWHRYDVTGRDDQVFVSVNGNLVVSDTKIKITEGWIGFRVVGGSLTIRNLQVSATPSATATAAQSEDFLKLLRAAEGGNALAQLQLGLAYVTPESVVKDPTKAFIWFRRAAEQGDPTAQLNAATSYEYGLGVPPDSAQAVSWLTKAAEQGRPAAQHRLGLYYAKSDAADDAVTAVAWLRKAAEQGFAPGQLSLGLAYAKGFGIGEDLAEAYKWLLLAARPSRETTQDFIDARDKTAKTMTASQIADGQKRADEWSGSHPSPEDRSRALPSVYVEQLRDAANRGDRGAQFNLAMAYAKGDGVSADPVGAADWLRKSAEQGYAQAQFALGDAYRTGFGLTQDDQQAVHWFREAAQQGHPFAQLNLGVMYESGRGVPQDFGEAAQWHRKAADQGNPFAQMNLGLMYRRGKGVVTDTAEGFRWSLKAAERGLPIAQLLVGTLYHQGDGVARDDVQAVGWLRKAAEERMPDAQYELALMFQNGWGVPQDSKEAVVWFSRAAERGVARAQTSLGSAYELGKGIQQDFSAALRLYRQAAAQGDAGAQASLGRMYEQGKGVGKELYTATGWYRQAAERNDPSAQFWLGRAYSTGDYGLSRDYVEGLAWLSLAAVPASNWQKQAAEARDSVAKKLKPAELADAQKRLDELRKALSK